MTGPIGYEARCGRCGEVFNPADEDDLEHVATADGKECGGPGVMVGAWYSSPTFCLTCGGEPGHHTDTAHEPNYATE